MLQRFNLQNLGTAVNGTEVARFELWRDQGNPGFSASEDRLLGSMSFTGARWEITGLSEPVSLSGIRVFVTADVAGSAARPATIRLTIPSGEDFGVGMTSRNSGPLNAPVANPEALLITVRDRVAVIADAIPPAPVYPGTHDVVLLDFTLSNLRHSTHVRRNRSDPLRHGLRDHQPTRQPDPGSVGKCIPSNGKWQRADGIRNA